MTKKERVLAAIAHKQTDKVPKGELYIESNIANKLIDKNYPLDYQHFDREKEVRELLHMVLVNLGEWPLSSRMQSPPKMPWLCTILQKLQTK
jgi:uroporphyrinogen decarboxylase